MSIVRLKKAGKRFEVCNSEQLGLPLPPTFKGAGLLTMLYASITADRMLQEQGQGVEDWCVSP